MDIRAQYLIVGILFITVNMYLRNAIQMSGEVEIASIYPVPVRLQGRTVAGYRGRLLHQLEASLIGTGIEGNCTANDTMVPGKHLRSYKYKLNTFLNIQ